jgi:hypothetical protein
MSEPTFIFTVLHPGKRPNIRSISSSEFTSGRVAFTLIELRNFSGGLTVADSIADLSHCADSSGEYSKNGENSPQPNSPLKSATSQEVTPRNFVRVGSATTRILSKSFADINYGRFGNFPKLGARFYL